jgi:hypothetical protein
MDGSVNSQDNTMVDSIMIADDIRDDCDDCDDRDYECNCEFEASMVSTDIEDDKHISLIEYFWEEWPQDYKYIVSADMREILGLIVNVDLDSKEANIIKSSILNADFNVIKIERIQHTKLFARFKSMQATLASSSSTAVSEAVGGHGGAKSPPAEAEEDAVDVDRQLTNTIMGCKDSERDSALHYPRELLHGTTSDIYKKIAAEGLDSKYANSSGHFGRGIYLSDSPDKANSYITTPYSAPRCILVVSTLLGNIKHYSPQTFERELIEAPAPYNSVKGNITGDDEYVIYNNEQTYISYIVHYKYPALKGWQYSYQCHIAMFKMRNPTADMPLPHHLTSFANFIKHYRPNHVMPLPPVIGGYGGA